MDKPTSRQQIRPRSPYLAWPTYCAAPPFSLSAILHGLELSQHEEPAQRAAGQSAQLRLLLEWAVNHVPYYRGAEGYADTRAALRRHPEDTLALWMQLPILTKPRLREHGPRLVVTSLPPAHGPMSTGRTSGSTGIPVEVGGTALTRVLWDAFTLREHLWQRRDFSRRLGIVRAVKAVERTPGGMDLPNWGPPVAKLYATGPASVIHVGYPVGEIAGWLRRFDPHYLLTHPSVAAALLEACGDAVPRSLAQVRLFAEPFDPALEERLRTAWGVPCTEIYSANEVGSIAIRCPEQGRLHIQSEALHVEILDAAGKACEVGGTGRVVITSLHNLATPLIRYELGDYATVGAACACGRTLPVIERVLGRVRNMACSPDGQRFYPANLAGIRAIRPIRQAQYVQTAPGHIDLRVVLDRALTDDETGQAMRFVQRALGFPFDVAIVPVDAIDRGPGGKFEEFLSLLPAR